MDLAVRRTQPVRADDHQRVERPRGVVAHLEHPGDHGGLALRRDLTEPGHERAVERLGVRPDIGSRRTEVAGERLRQHDEVRPALDARDRVEPGAVLGRIEAGGLLHERDGESVHVASLPDSRA